MQNKESFPVNEETLNLLINKLVEINMLLNKEIIELSNEELKKNKIYKLSSIYISLVNRAVELNSGYISLFSLKNYITAISLLRIQIENCLRFHALRTLDNMPHSIDEFLNGKELRKLTGNNGKPLTDTYLSKELDKLYPEYKFSELYKEYCEIIHFTGFYQNIGNEFLNKENGVSATLFLGGGSANPHFNIENKINYTLSLFYSTKIIYRMFSTYCKIVKGEI